MSTEERSREHEAGMALFALTSATETVCAMARSPDHRDYLVSDLVRISEAALAINLVWSALKKREAA